MSGTTDPTLDRLLRHTAWANATLFADFLDGPATPDSERIVFTAIR